jgi:putative ABC transport system ATP-binding protein
MKSSVETRDLRKHYAQADGSEIRALDGVSISVLPGALLAISGPSGSGKSTFLHIVGAMDRPDSGTVVVNGVQVSSLPRAAQPRYRRTIGFVFQRFHLLPALSALDNVAAPLLPYRTDFDKHERALELLSTVGLADRAKALPSELSGGQQQRVAIARALVNRPSLLLADEPTGNLDSKTGADLVELLRELRSEQGLTVLLATHNPLVASRCDRIIRLVDGQITDDVEVVGADDPRTLLARIGRMDA